MYENMLLGVLCKRGEMAEFWGAYLQKGTEISWGFFCKSETEILGIGFMST